MDSKDAATNSPLDITTDRSPDSGVSMDSRDSTPVEAPTGFPAHCKEPTAEDKLNESKILHAMDVNLPGEQLPAEHQFTRPFLKAPRRTTRKPNKIKVNVETPNNMDVDGSPTAATSSRPGTPFPDTPFPRKRGMGSAFFGAGEDPSKRSRHTSVSIDTTSKFPSVLSTPAPTSIPPPNNTGQLSLALPSAPSLTIGAEPYVLITGETLAARLSSLTEAQFLAQYILVDCRYPYEYAVGHIKYSINIYDVEELLDIFFPQGERQRMKISSRKPIFYGDSAQMRGPAMARELRCIDNSRRESPDLDYKTIYVLGGGYKAFFESGFVKHCQPQGYVPYATCKARNSPHPSSCGEVEKFHSKKSGSFCGAEQSTSTGGHQLCDSSSSPQMPGHSGNNIVQESPMLSDDFARAKIESSPSTPKVKRPTKGKRLRFDS